MRANTVFTCRQSVLLCAVMTVVACGAPGRAALVIERAALHPAFTITSGGPQNEGGPTDAGGTLVAILRNDSTTQPVTVDRANSTINGVTLPLVSNFLWALMYPPTLPPGGRGVLRIKGTGAPLAEGQTINLRVATTGPDKETATLSLAASPVTIGHVAPSEDGRSALVFIRNLSAGIAHEVELLEVNGENITGSLVNGPVLPPGGVAIARVQRPSGFATLEHLCIHVRARPVGGGTPVERVAGIRLTDPRFFTGSNGADWSEGMIQNARQWFGHEIILPGMYFNDGLWARRYDLRSIPIVFHGSPPAWDNLQWLSDLRNNPGKYAYYLADEPDLKSPAEWQSPAMARGVANVHANDPVTPTFVNLAKQKSFQQYAMQVDHPSFDHYGQFAPLVYSTGFLSSTYSIKNSLWYTDALKRNCEPLRQWCFAQGVDAVWGTQPADWGIKVQFWNHVIGGTKGILFFSAQPQYVGTHPAQKAAMEGLMRQLDLVRWVLAYGDVAAGGVTTGHPDLMSALVVSEHCVVVPVTNCSGTYTDNLLAADTVSMSAINGATVQITVPDWIPIERVREVGPNGLTTPAHSIAGRTVTITGVNTDTRTPHRVFLIGRSDTSPPGPVEEVQVVPSGASAFISWRMPHDDTGIGGYRVFRDGMQIGDVRTPLFTASGHHATAVYRVLAYDADMNVRPFVGSRGGGAGWTGTLTGDAEDSAHAYLNPANWDAGEVNDRFSGRAFTNAVFHFAADYTQGRAWELSNITGNVDFRGGGGVARAFAMTGDIMAGMASAAPAVVTFGSTTAGQNLNFDLNAGVRSFAFHAFSDAQSSTSAQYMQFRGSLSGGTGAGIGIDGNGIHIFRASNSYRGLTSVNRGRLQISDIRGLGASGESNGTVIKPGAHLLIQPNGTLLEDLVAEGGGPSWNPVGAIYTAGPNNLTFGGAVTAGAGGVRFGAFAGSTWTFTHKLTGTGNIDFTRSGGSGAPGVFAFAGGTHDYGGTVTINPSVRMIVDAPAALGSSAGRTIINSGELRLAGGITTAENFTIAGSNGFGFGGTNLAIEAAAGTSSVLQGELLLQTSAGVGGEGNVDHTGLLVGAASLTKQGSGRWRLAGNNPGFTGGLTAAAGQLVLNGTNANCSGLTVAAGATVGGTGVQGGTVVVNGVVAPGSQGGAGTFTCTGPMNVPGTLRVRLFSNGVSDRLTAGEGVVLGGVVHVVLQDGYDPVPGDIFDLVDAVISGGPAIALPALGDPGLSWNTDAFAASGVVFVSGTDSGGAFNSWMANYSSLTGSDSIPSADPDGDGFCNAAEFAFGGNPTAGTPSLLSVVRRGAEAVFRFIARKNPPGGVAYVVRQRESMHTGSWSPDTGVDIAVAADQTAVSIPTDYERREFSVPLAERRFYDVQATFMP